MRPVVAAAAAVPFLACTGLAAPAQAVPQPNEVTFVCGGTTYAGTAGSPMAVSARFKTPDGPATGSVKAAEGYPAFTGVPRRLLTRCHVYVNDVYLVDGYVLFVGPGSGSARSR